MTPEVPFETLVDALALQAVLFTPGDLPALGEFLSTLDACLEAAPEGPARSILEAVKQAGEKIVLADLEDSRENLETLARCVTLLQKALHGGEDAGRACLEEAAGLLAGWGVTVAATAGSAEDGDTKKKKGKGKARAGRKPKAPKRPAPAEPLPFMADPDLLKDFVNEAAEHLEQIEIHLLELEQRPDDKECINGIFRPFHTIKGVSGFLQLQDVNRLSHQAETLLDRVRNDQLEVSPALVDLVLDVVDILKTMIGNLQDVLREGPAAYRPCDISGHLERIEAMLAGETGPVPVPTKPLGEILVEKGVVTPEDVDAAIRKQREETPQARIGEILVQEGKADPKDVAHAIREQRQLRSEAAAVKVDLGKLDNLVDMVGELVIVQSLVQQNPSIRDTLDQKLQRDLSQLGRITSELQKNAMALRMVPIRHTFHKMIRLVRDLSKRCGKQVELRMSGEDTEIDRNMVEAIYDPLVHMIRNAVDHGLEPPEERAAAGKPETGVVLLEAYHKGGSIIIEIRDDGRGLDRTRIRKKAEERGLVREDETLADHEIDNLVFHPGFSTAESVTEVSGRGVGMDVVKRAIERLRGKVELRSTPGRGCAIAIRLPLTLAIIDGIVVCVGSERYIIPTIAIKQTLRPRRADYHTVQGRGEMIKVRGELIPLIRLYELFGVEPRQTDPCEALVVVVENEGQQRCLLVEGLLGKQEVVIKSLGKYLQQIRGVAGGTILGDGRVGLILDIAGIIESHNDKVRRDNEQMDHRASAEGARHNETMEVNA
ncbi:chemotaxis protein CheA [Dissulfurirhabdus thermomarina]|uniref:Chemotaxis protein CheA n=1 Tax=Dissulfurirhabdus thermomarina TaxID=1765737 RepID=A0A6N9TL65_DISTH|nr:chemotaxis protein CheA [Dissulfurirhabdus thermomarina]NDY41975.1 chemotaxis protein CheA [Dissulfurirhabdus thermomarina]NMX22802.1 chemotaxis protein CheA [Dissulfurirhabdus thermomarina]